MTSKIALPAHFNASQSRVRSDAASDNTMAAMKELLRVTVVCLFLSLLGGCASQTQDPAASGSTNYGSLPPYPGSQQFSIPANTTVNVVISSESCDNLQRTIITWPNQTQQTFEATTAASPDTWDDIYNAAKPTVLTYRTTSYNGLGGQVQVQVQEKVSTTWGAVWTRIQERPPLKFARVESEGHKNLDRVDWNDTVVAFTW